MKGTNQLEAIALRDHADAETRRCSMKRKIIVAGGSGFLGQALAVYFRNTGADVVVLTRSPAQPAVTGRQVGWDARTVGEWRKELEGAAVIVNLTGKSVNCRYHADNRRAILNSRVESTRALGHAIGQCTAPPPVWLNASTATIYRHTFGDPWDETGETEPAVEAKDAFSVEVAKAWEEAFDEAATPSTRKVAMRMAMVLGHGQNSVFPMLRRLAGWGFGGTMGSGRQFVSWIHETDYCRAVEHLISRRELEGVVNVAAPGPLPNCEMMRILRQVCGAPIGLPAAGWMLEVGAFFLRTETELIIKSRRVVPRRLLDSGFRFQFPDIRGAFQELCRR
jgi:uncharacterized protein